MTSVREFENIPDVRDGLTRKERIVLYCLDKIQKERNGRNVPTAMLYGRVVEYVDMSEQALQGILQRLSTSPSPSATAPGVALPPASMQSQPSPGGRGCF